MKSFYVNLVMLIIGIPLLLSAETLNRYEEAYEEANKGYYSNTGFSATFDMKLENQTKEIMSLLKS